MLLPPILSIKQKLRLMILATSAVALLLACAAFVLFGVVGFRSEVEHGLEVLAKVIGASASGAVEFEDAGSAWESINVLQHSQDIVAGCLYRAKEVRLSKEGKLLAESEADGLTAVTYWTNFIFATYVRVKAGALRGTEAGRGETLTPAQPPEEGFHPATLEYVKAIENVGHQKVGMIYLRFDHKAVDRFLWRCIRVVGLIMLLATAIALALASRFERQITLPLLQLLRTTRAVSEQKDYAVRATRGARDEIGHLVDAFNEMLEQIQTRDEELQRHREHLEEQVAARTTELTKLNQDLVAAKERAEEARHAADAANKTKSAFLANMSHELRTPLNAIIGYSEMLQEEAQDVGQETFVPDLQKIHTAGKHLLGLINDILDLSKVEAGKMTLYLETFDLAALARDVTATIQPLVASNANRLEVSCPADIGVMHADQTKVRQSLFNLLSNASKFTERGKITLEFLRQAEAEQEWVYMRVTDSGIGMSPEQLGRLFEAFTQANTAISRKYGGTGLGLVLSRNFCELMGGNLTVTSELGKGSTFTIKLPAEVQDSTAEAGSRPANLERRPAGSATPAGATLVLVIDDDPVVRDLMQRSLSKEGFRVETAAGGPQGLEAARKLQPAVITLDVMMPEMDGWAVLSRMKADAALAHIPVVMVTIVDERAMGFSLGIADYITKPIDWERLTSVLKKHQRVTAPQLVLVVEDEPAMRERLEKNLQKAGWTVSSAGNGRVAFERITASKPSLILLDLLMPEMDGFEFVDQLRTRPDCRDIPVIVITAKDITAEDRQRLNGRVNHIVQKGGMQLAEVLNEVKRLAGGHCGEGI
ncbi:MAG: response regulator [Limisphaerales bacterium]